MVLTVSRAIGVSRSTNGHCVTTGNFDGEQGLLTVETSTGHGPYHDPINAIKTQVFQSDVRVLGEKNDKYFVCHVRKYK